MAKEKIRVVLKQPNQEFEVKEITHDISVLQEFVEGYIDMTSLPVGENIDIICNDEFLCNEMIYHANIVVPEYENVFCGPLIFAGYDPETGATISLSDEQVEIVIDYINQHKVYNMDARMAYHCMLAYKRFQEENSME